MRVDVRVRHGVTRVSVRERMSVRDNIEERYLVQRYERCVACHVLHVMCWRCEPTTHVQREDASSIAHAFKLACQNAKTCSAASIASTSCIHTSSDACACTTDGLQ